MSYYSPRSISEWPTVTLRRQHPTTCLWCDKIIETGSKCRHSFKGGTYVHIECHQLVMNDEVEWKDGWMVWKDDGSLFEGPRVPAGVQAADAGNTAGNPDANHSGPVE